MKVVSTSLFGSAERYRSYFPVAIRAHHAVYPQWVFRVYHDEQLELGAYAKQLRNLHSCGLVELVKVDEPMRRARAFLWRLKPLWDPNVERFICRDIDTVPGYRERCAVEEWMRSKRAFHAIADKAGHHDFPTMGGMVGFFCESARRLIDAPTFDSLLDRAGWGEDAWTEARRVSSFTMNDQHFLAEHVWPSVKHDTMEHRLRGSRQFLEGECSRTIITEYFITGVNTAVALNSDHYVPFIGSADIDIESALAFYKRVGDPYVERAISECEAMS